MPMGSAVCFRGLQQAIPRGWEHAHTSLSLSKGEYARAVEYNRTRSRARAIRLRVTFPPTIRKLPCGITWVGVRIFAVLNRNSRCTRRVWGTRSREDREERTGVDKFRISVRGIGGSRGRVRRANAMLDLIHRHPRERGISSSVQRTSRDRRDQVDAGRRGEPRRERVSSHG